MKRIDLSLNVPEENDTPNWDELRQEIVRNFLEPLKNEVERLEIGNIGWKFPEDPLVPLNIWYHAQFHRKKVVYDDGFDLTFHSRGGAVLFWDNYPKGKYPKDMKWFEAPSHKEHKSVQVAQALHDMLALFQEAADFRIQEVKEAADVASALSKVSKLFATIGATT